MLNKFNLFEISFEGTYLLSCSTSIRRLHYHAQPSAEIRGMVLPVGELRPMQSDADSAQ